eukprot:Opistho-2@33057
MFRVGFSAARTTAASLSTICTRAAAAHTLTIQHHHVIGRSVIATALFHSTARASEESLRPRKDVAAPILPERRHLVHDDMVRKVICVVMKNGKKSTAEGIVHDALEKIKVKELSKAPIADPVAILRRALDNIKPTIETRPVRMGGTVFQVPRPVLPNRQQSLSLRWLVKAARGRKKGKNMAEALALEVLDAIKHEGGAVKKRMEVHKQAESNRAYAHYRWS